MTTCRLMIGWNIFKEELEYVIQKRQDQKLDCATRDSRFSSVPPCRSGMLPRGVGSHRSDHNSRNLAVFRSTQRKCGSFFDLLAFVSFCFRLQLKLQQQTVKQVAAATTRHLNMPQCGGTVGQDETDKSNRHSFSWMRLLASAILTIYIIVPYTCLTARAICCFFLVNGFTGFGQGCRRAKGNAEAVGEGIMKGRGMAMG